MNKNNWASRDNNLIKSVTENNKGLATINKNREI
jgi:hypothetical protein